MKPPSLFSLSLISKFITRSLLHAAEVDYGEPVAAAVWHVSEEAARAHRAGHERAPI